MTLAPDPNQGLQGENGWVPTVTAVIDSRGRQGRKRRAVVTREFDRNQVSGQQSDRAPQDERGLALTNLFAAGKREQLDDEVVRLGGLGGIPFEAEVDALAIWTRLQVVKRSQIPSVNQPRIHRVAQPQPAIVPARARRQLRILGPPIL